MASASPPRSFPLYLRVIVGVVVGVALGSIFGTGAVLGTLTTGDLGQLGMLVIRVLKALATPLILFAVLDAFLKTHVSAASGGRLFAVCAVNIAVAMSIGLLIQNAWNPGAAWEGQLAALGVVAKEAAAMPQASLSPLKNFIAFVPESLVDPFAKNLVISVVLVAVLTGIALRRVKAAATGTLAESMRTLEAFIEAGFAVLTAMLLLVADLMPFAVAGIIAGVVGASGIAVFKVLWVFLVTILAGLLLHALAYYPMLAWLGGRMHPLRFLRGALDPVITGLSSNSSLATMPVTLAALRKLGVREAPARLSACVGTNFNNDGIMLYEATATLFLCQAFGMELDFSEQLTVVAASIMAGVGIAGIPEAGLVILPLVLTAAGLPEASVAVAVPLIVPVDWIIARVRSGVNVLADMVVAIVLDRLEPREA